MARVLGPRELFAQVQQRGWCTGCGACVGLCPYFENVSGCTTRIFDCDLAQGRCFARCPMIELDLDELSRGLFGRPYDGSPLGSFREILAARAADKFRRGRRFQAGGVASVLTAVALEAGIIEAAALTDREGLVPVARLATSTAEVLACAGSKFMAAPTLSAVNVACRSGSRRLGLVGTPCQTAAAAQMRLDPAGVESPRVPIALVIGLFCTWAFDARAFIEHLSLRIGPAEVASMDIPPPPADVLRLTTASGEIVLPLAELRRLIPTGCRLCIDMTAEFADLSIGMFEGRPGWNTLMVRTPRGEEIVAAARARGLLETEPFPGGRLDHLTAAAAAKKSRGLHALERHGALNTPGGACAAVRMPAPVAARLLAERPSR